MNCQAMESIRRAFASGEFAKGQRLWAKYAGQLHQQILEGSATEAMLSETRELIDWSGLVVRAFRAHAVDRLNSAHLAQLYSSPTPEPCRMVRASF